MSTNKQPTTADDPSDSHLRTVTNTLQRIADDGERVALRRLARESGLSRAAAERAMCSIESVDPVSAKRVIEPGRDVAWRVSL